MRKGTKATRELVFAACEAIMNEGRIPTAREILSRTGGSLTTILEHHREWGARLSAAFAESRSLPGVPEQVAESFRRLWQTAQTQAQQQLDSEREGLRVDAERVHERVMAAQLQTERASARSAELEHELANAHSRIALLSNDLSRRTQEHDIIVSSLNALVVELKDRLSTLSSEHAAEVRRMTSEHQRLLDQHDARLRELDRLRALLPSGG